MKIQGSTVFVTGANRGLGAAFVELLVERSAFKIYAGARAPAQLAPLAARFPGRIVPIELDVTNAAHIASAITRCADTQILILNAGVTCIKPLLATADEAVFTNVMAVNYLGPMQMTRAFAPLLRNQGSTAGILYVLSMAALVPSPMAPIYSSSKAAAAMMAHGARSELKPHGVTVTMSYPGFMNTTMADFYDGPKVSPRLVATRSLDGLLDGATSVFPDAFAKITESYLLNRMRQILVEPHDAIKSMMDDYSVDPNAGN